MYTLHAMIGRIRPYAVTSMSILSVSSQSSSDYADIIREVPGKYQYIWGVMVFRPGESFISTRQGERFFVHQAGRGIFFPRIQETIVFPAKQ